MDVGLNTLLVALMFVTILCMGIGNILMVLADVFNHATPSRRDRVHVSWIVLLLLIHFNLFWNTKAILNVDDWRFAGFLMAIAGPVLMFFVTSIALTAPPEQDRPDLKEFFDSLGRRFYLMFAVLQIWVVTVSYSLIGSFIATDLVNVGLFALALFLARFPREPYQLLGIWIAWGLGLTSLAIRWIDRVG